MSTTHEMNPANGVLNQILKQDNTGETLRELLDRLTTSGKQVEASLDQPHTAAEQDVLQRMADAIRLGDTVLQRLWVKYHKRPAVL